MNAEYNLLRTDPGLAFDKAKYRGQTYEAAELVSDPADVLVLYLSLTDAERVQGNHRWSHEGVSEFMSNEGTIMDLVKNLFPPRLAPAESVGLYGKGAYGIEDLIAARLLTRLGRADLAESRKLVGWVKPKFDGRDHIDSFEFRVWDEKEEVSKPLLWMWVDRDKGWSRLEPKAEVKGMQPVLINRPEIRYAIEALAAELKAKPAISQAEAILAQTKSLIEATVGTIDKPIAGWSWKNIWEIFAGKSGQWSDLNTYLTGYDAEKKRPRGLSIAEKKAHEFRMTTYALADNIISPAGDLWNKIVDIVGQVKDGENLGFDLLAAIPEAERIFGTSFRPIIERTIKAIFASINGRVYQYKESRSPSDKEGLSPKHVFEGEFIQALKAIEQFETSMSEWDWLRQKTVRGFRAIADDRDFVGEYDIGKVRQQLDQMLGEPSN